MRFGLEEAGFFRILHGFPVPQAARRQMHLAQTDVLCDGIAADILEPQIPVRLDRFRHHNIGPFPKGEVSLKRLDIGESVSDGAGGVDLRIFPMRIDCKDSAFHGGPGKKGTALLLTLIETTSEISRFTRKKWVM